MDAKYSHAIEELYINMYKRLFIYAKCILKNDALAEEAVQETFRIACMKPEAVCNSENPKGWLIITLKNVISNTCRRRATADRILLDYISAKIDQLSISEDQIDFSLLYQNVADLEEFQLIKEMVLEGKSHLEMAQARGISVEACRKRVQRAKDVLKRRITV